MDKGDIYTNFFQLYFCIFVNVFLYLIDIILLWNIFYRRNDHSENYFFFVGFSWGQFLRCLDSCILHLKDALHTMFLQVKYRFSSRRKLNGSIFTVLCLLIIIIVINIKNMKSIFITNIIHRVNYEEYLLSISIKQQLL